MISARTSFIGKPPRIDPGIISELPQIVLAKDQRQKTHHLIPNGPVLNLTPPTPIRIRALDVYGCDRPPAYTARPVTWGCRAGAVPGCRSGPRDGCRRPGPRWARCRWAGCLAAGRRVPERS